MAEAGGISLLPLDIIIKILSHHLQFKDVVRTSAVAPSWRHLWTLVPSLRLCCHRDRLGDTLDFSTSSDVCSWVERVNRLISSSRVPLVDFELTLTVKARNFGAQLSPLLLSLFELLLQKGGGLETLYLHFPCQDVAINLPYFHALKVLDLNFCHVILPPGFRGFNRLTTLKMHLVQISNDDLNLLIRQSCNLTTLFVFDCVPSTNPLSVNISLPLLRHLYFIIDEYVEKVLVISAPCLEEAHFTDTWTDGYNLKSGRLILELVTSVPMVSSLNLSFDVRKYFSLVALPTFPRLRCLKFPLYINIKDKRTYDALVWLLRSMPFLEELHLRLFVYSSRAGRAAILQRELLVKKHDDFSCLNQSLKTVRIRSEHLGVVMTSITVVKFFMLNAKVLKLMKIEYCRGSEIEPRMVEELQESELTSSDAEVIIKGLSERDYLFGG
ncbi:F-box/RNI-like/FBD-like domains-containing protein [Rhynchospora pubera]|uniref:F-box/RNI-like/FBD-like domains-containing protein n=1 Tax=Rhynchospora pubera TaxID=906938 RepID=A0AAV8DAV4_9POAL|nr:F-box/RNI-like/FBD-like domains-containing protein [Rhynchospora pubera]